MLHFVLIHANIIPNYIWHPLGYCPSGPSQLGCKGYNIWSGILGSFLTSIPGWAVATLIFWRHTNCHKPWCPRVGKHPLDGTPYKVCKVHHPDIPNKLTLEYMHQAYKKVQNVRA